jgi:hypothetical protein
VAMEFIDRERGVPLHEHDDLEHASASLGDLLPGISSPQPRC